MRVSTLITALLFAAGLLGGATVARAESDTAKKIATAMSGYHFAAKTEELEALAGGQDQLVSALLELRMDNKRPFVAIRAERLLLAYADREDVHQALLQDLSSTEHKGLARTVATHIDRAPEKARRSLAKAAVDRAQRDADFTPYAKAMKESTDPELRTLARSLGE